MYALIARKKASHTMNDGTRSSPSGSLGTLRPRCPKEYLLPILVQNSQAIGVRCAALRRFIAGEGTIENP
jgi:hypothetical protein